MDAIINYAIGLLGLILAVVGIYLTIRSNKKKEPVYAIKSNNLISGSASTLKDLNLTYKDQKVENLTVSKILFYNRGAETINKQDLKTINPLSISSEICKILDGSILQANNHSNNIRVIYNPSNKNVYIDFDYLDKNQGAVIQIVHTGVSSKFLSVYGDIIGVEKLIEMHPDKFEPPPKLASFVGSIGLRIVFMVVILGIFFLADILNNMNISVLIIAGAFLFIIFDIIPFILKTIRGRVLPKGLEKFNE